MFEMVDEGKMTKGSDQDASHDLFSKLLEASESDMTGRKLTDREVISNIFIFLFAGMCLAFLSFGLRVVQ